MSVQTPRGTQRSADVVLTNSAGQQLIVEVWYEHRKEVEAVEDYRDARLPAVELPVSDDDHDVSPEDLRSLLRERAKWIVEPYEPFESDTPPRSQLPQSHLRARISHEAMQRRGFKLEGQVWERHQSSLTARIIDVDSYPERVRVFRLFEKSIRLVA